jgi:hypothetical protein
VPSVAFSHSRHYHSSTSRSHSTSLSTDILDSGSRSIDLKGKRIIIKYNYGTPRRADINERHELRVDGDLVKLNVDQQQLVGEFYDKTQLLIADAKAIGLEGAAIGLQGVGVMPVLTGLSICCSPAMSDDLNEMSSARRRR